MWRLAEDTISSDDLRALTDWLLTSPPLTQGGLVRQFESDWSQWLGVEHSVMVGSGTAANLAAILALELKLQKKPRVGVSAVTWATNVTPSMLLGHEITVFDVDRSSLGVSPEQVTEAMRNGDLDALFVTHLLGFDALTDEILSVAEETGTLILEDCCESHGACHGNHRVGTFGLFSTFSFYYGHHMSTIEGGIICTNDAEFADLLRLIRSHGLARESARFEEYCSENSTIDPEFLFVIPGLNLRSSELNAFLGCRQLLELDARIVARNRNFQEFIESAPPGVFTGYRLEGISSFAIPLIVEDQSKLAAVKSGLRELEIEYRPVVAGNLLRQPFLAAGRVQERETPVADWVHQNGIYVGNGPHVTEKDVRMLTERLKQILI